MEIFGLAAYSWKSFE